MGFSDPTQVMFWLRQFLNFDILLQCLLLAGFLLILMFRPERIHSPALFRLSYILFAVALVFPTLFIPFVNVALDQAYSSYSSGMGQPISPWSGPPYGSAGSGINAPFLMRLCVNTSGTILLALSAVFCIASMVPKRSTDSLRRSAPPPAAPHPLD